MEAAAVNRPAAAAVNRLAAAVARKLEAAVVLVATRQEEVQER